MVGDAPGVLEDYAAMIMAAVALAASRGGRVPGWSGPTCSPQVITTEFADGDGFFDTAADAESLYLRPQDPSDNATPSGLSTTVHALALLGEATGRTELVERADRAAATAGGLVDRAPRFAGWLVAAAASRLVRPPVEVAIAGDPGDAGDRRAGPDRVPTCAGRFGDHGRRPGHSRGWRCWPTDPCGTADRRRTCVAGSSAGCRSPSRRSWPPSSERAADRAQAANMASEIATNWAAKARIVQAWKISW